MFKLHRKSSSSSSPSSSIRTKSSSRSSSSNSAGGLKFDFTFDNFRATQVPPKWDRLLISLISVETGKTIGKSGKASVRNGVCEWKDTSLSESLLIIHDDKEQEQHLFKFLVSMGGGGPSSILGHVIINLTDYIHHHPTAFTFPLKNCTHGTTLQLNIHCLTPNATDAPPSVDSPTRSNHSSFNTRTMQSDDAPPSFNNQHSSNNLLEQENRILALQLQEKDHEIQNERCLNTQKLLDMEMEYKHKLSEAIQDRRRRSIEENGPDANLIGEIEMLKEKVMELENDCNELTDENFELLLKLKDLQNISPKSHLDEEEIKKNNEQEFDIFELVKQIEIAFSLVRKPCYNISSRFSDEFEFSFESVVKSNRTDVLCQSGQAELILNYMVELNKVLDTKITECDEALKHGEAKIRELESKNVELVDKNADQVQVSISQRDEIVQSMAGLLSKDEEIRVLRQFKTELESQVSDLQADKVQMEENMETAQQESEIASKCVNGLRNDIAMLSSTVDFHVDTNKCLEEKLSELESENHGLGLHFSELEQENILLSERISRLEAQIRIELETGKVDLKEKLEDTERRLSEAQEECENLKKLNLNLEATANFTIEESIFLKKSNGEFEKQNFELHEQCTKVEAEFRGLSVRLVDFSDRLINLEENIISLLKDFATKEESVNSEINVLLEENRKHNEKLIMVESLLNKPKSGNQELKTIVNDLELKLSERSEGANGYDTKDGRHHGAEVDLLSKIQLLENELADALDANNLYKAQLNRLLPGGRNSDPDNPRNEKMERTQSSVQAELRDLQERYFNMSLKYAEVEAEREDLVMKLKKSKSVKRWFS